VGECFFWYRPTRVVPEQRPLNGCVVCVCVCVLLVRIECKKSIDEECICCALEHLSNIMEFNFQQGHSLSISSLMNDV